MVRVELKASALTGEGGGHDHVVVAVGLGRVRCAIDRIGRSAGGGRAGHGDVAAPVDAASRAEGTQAVEEDNRVDSESNLDGLGRMPWMPVEELVGAMIGRGQRRSQRRGMRGWWHGETLCVGSRYPPFF